MKKTLPRLSLLATVGLLFGSVLVSCSGSKENTESNAVSDSGSATSYSAITRTYKVTFISDGRTYDILEVKEGDRISETETPEKKGYSFDGWYMDENTWKIPFDTDTVVRQDMNVYAKWSLVSYSITYKGPNDEDLNIDGTELPSSYTIEDENLPLVAYTLKGYRFKCWEKEGLVMNYIPTGSVGDLVLQGKFDDTFTIRYVDSKFGKKNDSNPEIFNATMDPIELLPLEDTTDYSFAGWVDELGTKVTEIDTSCGDDITLYATWELKVDFSAFDYIVDEDKNICMLLGVKDKTTTSLEIPEVFNAVKPGALSDLTSLEELTVQYIGYDKEVSKNYNLAYFFGVTSNDKVPSNLKKVTVNGGDVAEYAFANLAYVEEIVLAPEIMNIGYYAFYNCSSLLELTMPVRNIPTAELESKVEPWSTRPASSAQYYGIAGSANAKIPYNKDKLLTVHLNGGDKGIGFSMFDYCLGLGKVTIDNTNVHYAMFAYCKNLTEVTIGNNVEEIHAASFSTCTSLTEIVIPDSVKGLGKYYTHAEADGIRLGSSSGSMFYDTPITKAVIGNGTEIIPSNMFYGNSIKEITIGEKVRYVANRALYLPYDNTLPDDFTLINNSKQKTWIMSGELDVKFIKAVLASENAPERICYVSYDRDFNAEAIGTPSTYKDNTNYQYFVSIYGDKLDESEKKKFVFYSKNDPYADGGVASTDNADIEYWHHEQGDDWYFRTYCVDPVLWTKP